MFLEKYAPKRVHLILFCCIPLLCFIFSQKQLNIRTKYRDKLFVSFVFKRVLLHVGNRDSHYAVKL